MKNFYYRFSNAFKIFVWAFKNPRVIEIRNFEMLSSLFGLIMKVAQERRPYITNISTLHPIDTQDADIVSIWAGSGIGADPIKRIAELKTENEILKADLLAKISVKD